MRTTSNLPQNESLLIALDILANSNEAFKPKLVYWPAEKKYFVSYVFSTEHIATRGMKVIDEMEARNNG